MIKFKKKDKPNLLEMNYLIFMSFLDNIMNDQKQIKDKIKKIYLDLTRFKTAYNRHSYIVECGMFETCSHRTDEKVEYKM